MPTYDFQCGRCGARKNDKIVASDVTHITCSTCGGTMARLFPVEAIRGFQPFEPYYDEALDCDVTGRQEKRRILKDMDLHEAGDRKHGGINFDAKAPHHVKPLPLRGRPYAKPVPVKEEWVVAFDKDGKPEKVDVNSLKSL